MTATRTTSQLVERASYGSVVLGVGGAVLWLVAVHEASFGAMAALGLITVLGRAYFIGLGLVVVGFSLELLRIRPRQVILLALTALLVVYLFGTACAIEPTASLASSWVHAGYSQYILTHGRPLNGFAAEFSWPGGFSLVAVLVAFAGRNDALAMLQWFPLFVELLCLAPLLVIVRSSGVSRRAGWLAVALFYSANWIDQDYFSPQALAYFLYLVTIAAVMSCWRPRPLTGGPAPRSGAGLSIRARLDASRGVLSLRRIRGDDAVTSWPPRTVLGLLALVSLIMLGISVSHQLTPYALLAALCACLLTRRLGRPELIALLVLFAIGWLSLGASNFWIGHLGVIFGSIGALGSSFGSNVASRVTGSSSHRLVVDARILLTAALFGIAAIGALRRAADSRTIEALAIVPFFLLVFQNYGGEGLLRVVLFALPFASLLAASAVFPSRAGSIRPVLPTLGLGRHGRVALAATASCLILGFSLATTFVRGGNDAYESFSLGELAAVNFAYAHASSGQTIAMIAPYLPISQRDIGSVHLYVVANSGTTPTLGQMARTIVDSRKPTMNQVILSATQERWGEIVAGYPKGWQSTLERALLRHGYRISASWPTATVLRRLPSP